MTVRELLDTLRVMDHALNVKIRIVAVGGQLSEQRNARAIVLCSDIQRQMEGEIGASEIEIVG